MSMFPSVRVRAFLLGQGMDDLKPWVAWSSAMSLAGLLACGGSGGGGAVPPPAPQLTLSVTPDPIYFRDQTSDGLGSSTTVTITVTNVTPGTTFYSTGTITTSGVFGMSEPTAVVGAPATEADTTFGIYYKVPATLGAGTYTDTLTVSVSTDPAGTRPIAGSPQVIPITYTVSGPAVTALSPESAVAGTPGLTLTVTGTGFESGSIVAWDGNALATAFVSPTQLQAQIPATDLASVGPGYDGVMVLNGGNDFSNVMAFTVLAGPVPAASAAGAARIGLEPAAKALATTRTW